MARQVVLFNVRIPCQRDHFIALDFCAEFVDIAARHYGSKFATNDVVHAVRIQAALLAGLSE